MKSTTRQKAESMILDAQNRFRQHLTDLETIQAIVLYRLEGERIEGDEINDFYYESVKNWVLSYEG